MLDVKRVGVAIDDRGGADPALTEVCRPIPPLIQTHLIDGSIIKRKSQHFLVRRCHRTASDSGLEAVIFIARLYTQRIAVVAVVAVSLCRMLIKNLTGRRPPPLS